VELINNTPIAAELIVTEILDAPNRFGMISAKVTYCLNEAGAIEIDTQDPFPLFESDVETELGLLPRDNLPRMDPVFEVILLGTAYAPKGQPVTHMKVTLTVGTEYRELMVVGNRVWENSNKQPRISSPQPFARMPLTYDRAFGGLCEVLIDKDSPIEISDPNNPLGKGFNPETQIRALADFLKYPEGYPIYDTTRALPNIENATQPIVQWEDLPTPAYWATVPLTSALHIQRAVDVNEDAETPQQRIRFSERTYHRAYPDWVIDLPIREATVALRGLTPQGALTFKIPALRILGDYVNGPETGTHELVPQMLVLLPEEMRFYLVYRRVFPIPFIEEQERSMRLRIENGWYNA
jgi:hypothetical protein